VHVSYICQAYSQTPDPVSVQLSGVTGTHGNGVNKRVDSHQICIKSASDPNRDNFAAARHVPAAMRSRLVAQSESRVHTRSRTARALARAFRPCTPNSRASTPAPPEDRQARGLTRSSKPSRRRHLNHICEVPGQRKETAAGDRRTVYRRHSC
jgi:hypothetical protein